MGVGPLLLARCLGYGSLLWHGLLLFKRPAATEGGPPYNAYQGYLVLSLDLEIKFHYISLISLFLLCPEKIFCLDFCRKNFLLCAQFFLGP